MAKNTQKDRVSLSVIITGLVMMLLFVGLAAFLVSQRDNIPTVDEQTAEVRLKNLAELNAENQKIPDPVSLGRQKQGRGRNSDRSSDGFGCGSIAGKQAARSRAD